jgi:hypothetical protein
MKKFIYKHLNVVFDIVIFIILVVCYEFINHFLDSTANKFPTFLLLGTGILFAVICIFVFIHSCTKYCTEKYQRIDCTDKIDGEILSYHDGKPIIKVSKEHNLCLDIAIDKNKYPVGSIIPVYVNESLTNIHYLKKDGLQNHLLSMIFSIVGILGDIFIVLFLFKII